MQGKVLVALIPESVRPKYWQALGYRLDHFKRDENRECYLAAQISTLQNEIAELSKEPMDRTESIYSIFYKANPRSVESVLDYIDRWWREGRINDNSTGPTLMVIAETYRPGSVRALKPWLKELNQIAERFLLLKKAEGLFFIAKRANLLLPTGIDQADFANWECKPRVPGGRSDREASAMNWIATTGQAVLSEICTSIQTSALEGETYLVIGMRKIQDQIFLEGLGSDLSNSPVCIETVSDLLESLGYTTQLTDVPPDWKPEGGDGSEWVREPWSEYDFDLFLEIKWAVS